MLVQEDDGQLRFLKSDASVQDDNTLTIPVAQCSQLLYTLDRTLNIVIDGNSYDLVFDVTYEDDGYTEYVEEQDEGSEEEYEPQSQEQGREAEEVVSCVYNGDDASYHCPLTSSDCIDNGVILTFEGIPFDDVTVVLNVSCFPSQRISRWYEIV